MKVEHITIVGMIITVILSLGGSWVGTLITNAEQTSAISELNLQAKKSSKANSLTYILEEQMTQNQKLDDKQQKEIDKAKEQVSEAEVNSARREANQINLTKSMDRLITSVERLIIKVDEQTKIGV